MVLLASGQGVDSLPQTTIRMKFYSFSSIVCQGASGAGKTHMMLQILKEKQDMFWIIPHKIIYVYSHYQEIYDQMAKEVEDITFIQSLPTEEMLTKMVAFSPHSLLIIDDQLSTVANSPFVLNVFTRMCHHLKITCFLLLQASNLSGTKYGPDIIRSSHYHILFRSPQIGHYNRTLGIRINDYRNLSEAYKLATRDENYSYLMVCLHPRSSQLERYSSRILPSDKYCIIYSTQR